jgi:UDP-N-acetylmuramate dehydrogenase
MNTGDATVADVLALIEYTRAEVRQQFGVELELEIELVG